MPGYFSVTITNIGPPPPVANPKDVKREPKGIYRVDLRVESVNDYKGSVGMTYRDVAGVYVCDPNGRSLYVPKNGFVTDYFEFSIPGSTSITVEASGFDGTLTDADQRSYTSP